MADRLPLPGLLLQTRVVAVVRAPSIGGLDDVVETLVRNGISTIELTLTTPAAVEALGPLRARWGDEVSIGMGTVTTSAQAQECVDAGAEFLVTPITVPEIAAVGIAAGVPTLMGALSPTEVHTAWVAGAAAIKVFPASLARPGYLRELAGPFPDLRTVPSGGVAIEDIPEWIAAGSVAVSLGGALLSGAFSGDLDGLAERSRRAVLLASSRA